MNLCMAEEWRHGVRVFQWWLEQGSLDLEGMWTEEISDMEWEEDGDDKND